MAAGLAPALVLAAAATLRGTVGCRVATNTSAPQPALTLPAQRDNRPRRVDNPGTGGTHMFSLSVVWWELEATAPVAATAPADAASKPMHHKKHHATHHAKKANAAAPAASAAK